MSHAAGSTPHVVECAAPLVADAGVRLRLRGGSMRYSLPRGCQLVVSRNRPLRRGGIYVYRDGDALVAHRLIALEGLRATTAVLRGEHADAGVERIDATSIIGEVVAFRRRGRWCRTTGYGHRLVGLLWTCAPAAARRLTRATARIRSIGRRLRRRLRLTP